MLMTFIRRWLSPSDASADIDSMLESAKALHTHGNLDSAAQLYEKIISKTPEHFEALHRLGVLRYQQEQYLQASELLQRALQLEDQHYAVHSNLATVLKERKLYNEALIHAEKAITLSEHHDMMALINHASILYALDQQSLALASCNQALDLSADNPIALGLRGKIKAKLQQLPQALEDFEAALIYAAADEHWTLANQADLLFSKASALTQIGDHQHALTLYKQAWEILPSNITFNAIGHALYELMQFDEAIINFEQALKVDPNNPGIHLNKALAHLITGDFDNGLQEYEWRNKNADGNYKLNYQAPLWLGQTSLLSKTILLHGEQGLGDCILALRYVNALIEAGATVSLNIPTPLHSITRDSFPQVDFTAPTSNHDFECPLMSLPLAFNAQVHTLSNQPYLKANIAKVNHWKSKLPSHGQKLVGIAWSGNPNNPTEHTRSMPLSTMLKLSNPNTQLVCLKKDFTDEERALLTSQNVLYFDNALHDFSDTAALIEALDLVIAVDTSVAHLAGALGKPTWILLAHNADWRWFLDREDSPWYASVQLCRQSTAGDWDELMQRIVIKLNGGN